MNAVQDRKTVQRWTVTHVVSPLGTDRTYLAGHRVHTFESGRFCFDTEEECKQHLQSYHHELGCRYLIKEEMETLRCELVECWASNGQACATLADYDYEVGQ